jgi:hypothetical protein
MKKKYEHDASQLPAWPTVTLFDSVTIVSTRDVASHSSVRVGGEPARRDRSRSAVESIRVGVVGREAAGISRVIYVKGIMVSSASCQIFGRSQEGKQARKQLVSYAVPGPRTTHPCPYVTYHCRCVRP